MLLAGFDVDFFASKVDDAVRFGKNGVIFTHADVEAGVKFRAALTYDDRSGLGKLPAIKLYAAILRITVATVSG